MSLILDGYGPYGVRLCGGGPGRLVGVNEGGANVKFGCINRDFGVND